MTLSDSDEPAATPPADRKRFSPSSSSDSCISSMRQTGESSTVVSDEFCGTEEIYAGNTKSWATVSKMKSQQYHQRLTSPYADTTEVEQTSMSITSSSSCPSSPVRDLKLRPDQLKSDTRAASSKHIASAVNRDVHYGLRSSPEAALPSKDVVRVRNASKSYGSKLNRVPVLDHLNMTIKEGQIYGLLGASGCGKTTLLSCLVGLKSLDDGIATVFGGTPGDRRLGVPGTRIGYMPQETAIFNEFDIRETFVYFGRIYGMTLTEINHQKQFLMNLLDLPSENTRVHKLSGGQQRRVSFAMSLLHHPQLLILDEPTVGVDPMLRQSIWNYLLTLARAQPASNANDQASVLGRPLAGPWGRCPPRKTTIVITTHYIEEARHCSVVGLMNEGQMLTEDAPASLMTRYGAANLEDVFLKLCLRQQQGLQTPDAAASAMNGDTVRRKSSRGLGHILLGHEEAKHGGGGAGGLVYPGMTASLDDFSIQPLSYSQRNVDKAPSMRLSWSEAPAFRRRKSDAGCLFSCCECPSPSRIWAMVEKNLIKMRRNWGTLLFNFLLPAIQISIFCLAVGRTPTGLKLGVVNDEMTPFTDGCNYFEGCDFENISCRYLTALDADPTLDLRQFETEAAAMEAAQQGDTWGVLRFGANFSRALVKTVIEGRDAEEDQRNMSLIHVNLDLSNHQNGQAVVAALTDNFRNVSRSLLEDCSMDPSAVVGDFPFAFGDPVYGQSRPEFTQFMAPGLVVLIVFFFAVGLTGQAFIHERRDGLLHRSWVAGVTPFELVFAQIATQCLVLVGQCAISLVVTLLVFNIECRGPVVWIAVITVLQGMAGMSYGFLLSTVFKDESAATQTSIGSFYPLMLLSGILWPIEGMPQVLRRISVVFPCTLATQAMRDVMSRGWNIAYPSVYYGIVSSLAWIAFFLFTAFLLVKFKKW